MTSDQEIIKQAAEAVGQAEALLICAGAGMGVDSGLPDFRGNQGFWQAYPPYAEKGLGFTDMANPDWFVNDPTFAWGFYGHRLNLYRQTQPHHGFKILDQWAADKPGGAFVFTSNVDGQFQKAGFDDAIIKECHGSIHHLQCTVPCGQQIWSAAEVQIAIDEATMHAQQPLPQCPRCGKVARPNVLMFGDWLWVPHRSEGQGRQFQRWLLENKHRRLAIVECGAGTAVPTVRYTSEEIVWERGARLIRINPRAPQVPNGQLSLPLGAAETLAQIDALLR